MTSTTALGWYQIPNTQLAPNCPDPNAYPSIQGIEGCSAVIADWSGGMADTKRNRLIIWGGGHGGYFGNEVYALDLNALKLVRLNDPTALPQGYSGCTEKYPDGKPASRHTYGGLTYVPPTDTMVAFSGGLSVCGSMSDAIWSLNLGTLEWINKAPAGSNKMYGGTIPMSDYDPDTGKVFFHDTAQLWSYEVAANKLTPLSAFQSGLAIYEDVVIDPGRKKFFIIGHGLLSWYDISGNDSKYVRHDIARQVSRCADAIGPDYPGLAYDPVQKVIVIWNGGNSIYLYNYDTRSCTTQTYPNGPGAQQQHGTNGRFRYFPALGVFALVNDWQQNAYTLRLTSGGPPPSQAVSVGVSPAATAVQAGGAQQSSASYSNRGVKWSATAEVIIPTGSLPTPQTDRTARVRATSQADRTISASATATVTASAAPPPPSDSEAGFKARCAAPGVIVCEGFDDPAHFSTPTWPNTGLYHAKECPTCAGQDTSVKVSGAGSLRMRVPANSTENEIGNWLQRFGRSFNQGETFYVQFRFRPDQVWAGTAWTKYGPQGSNTAPKIAIFHNNKDGTCAEKEITTHNHNGWNLPTIYTECGGRAAYTALDGVTVSDRGDFLLQQGFRSPEGGYKCKWGDPRPIPIRPYGCFNFPPNVWTTLYYKIHIGDWGKPNSSIEAWVGGPGQVPLKKFINANGYILNQDTNGQPGFDSLTFTQFMTGLDPTKGNPSATVWYDELIVSTQPIAAPK